MRTSGLTFSILALATTLTSQADNPRGVSVLGHPHFDDGGALSWHERLAPAKAAAKDSDKLILVEYGRAA